MIFKYEKHGQIAITKKTYLFWNGSTRYVSVNDKDISHLSNDWSFASYADLSKRDFDFLKKNNLIRAVKGSLSDKGYTDSQGKRHDYFYWVFTEEAINSDMTIYAPYVKREEK